MCRNQLSEEHLLEPAPETSGSEDSGLDLETQSSKTQAMLQILQATFKKEGSKVIIFSQWLVFQLLSSLFYFPFSSPDVDYNSY